MNRTAIPNLTRTAFAVAAATVLTCSCHSKAEVKKIKVTSVKVAPLWHVTEDTDPMTDEKRFLVSASDGHGNSFFAGCGGGALGFGLSSDLYLGDGSQTTEVEYRLDQLEPVAGYANVHDTLAEIASPREATGEELLVDYTQIRMGLELMKPHQRLRFRLRSVTGEKRDFEFNALGLSTALADLVHRCSEKRTHAAQPKAAT